MNTKKSVWQVLSLSGIIGVLIYTAHVVIGGFLWKGYSHIKQTISELTGSGAPNAGMLKILTTVYGILMIIFSISLYFIFRQLNVHKAAKTGAFLLIIMEAASFIGYYLYPLNTSSDMTDFQNIMHIAVTAVVVISTISAFICTGMGLFLTPAYKHLGVFVIICTVIIVFAGGLTPVVMTNELPLSGLTERINIFTIQICLSVLSVSFFREVKIHSTDYNVR